MKDFKELELFMCLGWNGNTNDYIMKAELNDKYFYALNEMLKIQYKNTGIFRRTQEEVILYNQGCFTRWYFWIIRQILINHIRILIVRFRSSWRQRILGAPVAILMLSWWMQSLQIRFTSLLSLLPAPHFLEANLVVVDLRRLIHVLVPDIKSL